eukprot:101014-Pleurochrysis_carterae.AAC.4
MVLFAVVEVGSADSPVAADTRVQCKDRHQALLGMPPMGGGGGEEGHPSASLRGSPTKDAGLQATLRTKMLTLFSLLIVALPANGLQPAEKLFAAHRSCM